MADATFTVNGVAVTGAVSVSASSTVTLAIADTTGILANAVSWSCVGTHYSTATAPTITPGGTPNGVTATFTMPAGTGQAYLIQAQINGGLTSSGTVDSSATFRAVIGVETTTGIVPFVVGETTERSATHGITEPLNDLANASSATFASVIDYGADSSGVSDSTTAFDDALTANDIVYIPSGTYIIKELVVGADKVLFGAGRTTILQYPDGDAGGSTPSVIILDGGTLRDVKVDGNYSAVTNTSGTYGAIYGTAGGNNSRIINVDVFDSVNRGVSFYDCDDVRIENLFVTTHQSVEGLYFDASIRAVVKGLKITNGPRGLFTTSTCTYFSLDNYFVSGCTQQECDIQGDRSQIENVRMIGASGSLSLVRLFGSYNQANNIWIYGGIFDITANDNVATGITVYGGYTSWSINIGGVANSLSGFAIYDSNGYGINITGNRCSVSSGTIFTSASHAIYENGDDNVISNVVSNTSGGSGIVTGSSSVRAVISNLKAYSPTNQGVSLTGDYALVSGCSVYDAGLYSYYIGTSGAEGNDLRCCRSISPTTGSYYNIGTNTTTIDVDGAPNIIDATTSHTFQVGGTAELELTGAALYPSTDGGITLGSSSYGFSTGYFGGGTYPASGGIRLGSGACSVYGVDSGGNTRGIFGMNIDTPVFGNDDSTTIQFRAGASYAFYAAASVRLRLSTSALYPATAGGLTSGTAALPWGETYGGTGYFGGGTYPASGGLRLGSSTPSIAFSDGTYSPTWQIGTGTPEGVVTAAVGSLFTRVDGGTSTTLYVKETGTGNTGWVAK